MLPNQMQIEHLIAFVGRLRQLRKVVSLPVCRGGRETSARNGVALSTL